jgi:hypothetical protein
MQEAIIRALRGRRDQIRARWEALLRIEEVTTPLANPDTLVFGIDRSLNEIFNALRHPPHPPAEVIAAEEFKDNPWHAYFRAGEQALLETLVIIQSEMSSLDPTVRDRSFAALKHVINVMAQREIYALASVCHKRAETHPRPH